MNEELKTQSNYQSLFSKVKVRYIFLDLFLLSILFGIILAIIILIYPPFEKIFQDTPDNYFSSFFSNITLIVYFILILLRLFKKLNYQQIDISKIFGKFPSKKNIWGQVFILISASELLFWGINRVRLFFNTIVFPRLIEETRSNLIYDGNNIILNFIVLVLSFILEVVIMPITIEFIFRGLILHRWATKWGLIPGILISSFLYGLLALDSGFIGFIMFSIWGIIMSLLYIKTRSLIAPIIGLAFHLFIVTFMNDFIATYLVDEIPPPAITLQFLWVGILYIIMSLPSLIYFLKIPKNIAALPYIANEKMNKKI